MKGFYFVNEKNTEFFYIPNILISFRHSKERDAHHNYDPEVLKKFRKAELRERLSRQSLENRGWEFEEINIPDQMILDFMNSCFRNRSKRKLNNHASRIFYWAYKNSRIGCQEEELEQGEIEFIHEGGYKEIIPYDDKDQKEYWWLKGKPNPGFTKDYSLEDDD